LAEYEDFATNIAAARRDTPFPLAAETPGLLEPTSGSSSAPKLIPLTHSLQREFAAAIQPWIAWLYLAHPRLLFGHQYWALSPSTPPPPRTNAPDHSIPVGFSDDADYLGVAGRFLSRRILAVPPELHQVADRETFALLTLFFLLKERNLRLVSVWHPSFLTLLIDALPRHLPALLPAIHRGSLPGADSLAPELRRRLAARIRPDPRRAAELAALDLPTHPEHIARAWPRLAVISCWTGERSEPWLGQLRSRFPQAAIQPKGLLATEGVVTLPTGCGKRHPCAIRSHVLEFIDTENGRVLPVWQLESGHEYSVVITTGGGLWRYRLHDRVRVTGFCHATPCLEFLGKDNLVSDLVGEKLDERHVAEALAAAAKETGQRPCWSMLLPDASPGRGPPGYVLLLERPPDAPLSPADGQRWADAVERHLRRNYHYDHARQLGQLRPLRILPVSNGLAAYRAARESCGTRAATLKPSRLDPNPRLLAILLRAIPPGP
jgi:hypothetical protein